MKRIPVASGMLVQEAKKYLRGGARYARLGLNLTGGGLFISACHQFPNISKINERHLNDYKAFNFWVEDLVYSMNTRLTVSGEAIQQQALFVCNHISWLDTIVLNHVKMSSFIARHDIIDWPFIGTFTDRMHSLFINRTNKFEAYRSIPKIEERLNEGRSVVVFPESTTSNGRQLLPFYPMFLEAAVRTKTPVQPVYLSYQDSDGNHIDDPAFIDDDSFIDTLTRIFLVDKVHAHLHYLPVLDSSVMNRKELAWSARQLIGQASCYRK